MKKQAKIKYPKIEATKKYPTKPKNPKGGIKTPRQLEVQKEKKAKYIKACNAVDTFNKGIPGRYKTACKKVDALNKAAMKVYDDFNDCVKKVNTY